MKKMGLMYAFLILLESFSAPAAWANRGGHHGGHGGHWHGSGFAFGLGVLGGYGLGYYGRGPYYSPYYRYGPAYGYGYAPYGYPAYGFSPWYGYTPGYAYPPVAPVVVTPAQPPVYIQQQPVIQSQPQPPATNYWHYCRNPEGYYPYVKNCPEGWLQVAPQPGQ